jgi:hypothetical protein
MAKVVFTPNMQRHVWCPEAEAPGRTVREVLENVFSENLQVRSYVLDDQSGLRKHMTSSSMVRGSATEPSSATLQLCLANGMVRPVKALREPMTMPWFETSEVAARSCDVVPPSSGDNHNEGFGFRQDSVRQKTLDCP